MDNSRDQEETAPEYAPAIQRQCLQLNEKEMEKQTGCVI